MVKWDAFGEVAKSIPFNVVGLMAILDYPRLERAAAGDKADVQGGGAE